VPQRRLAKVVRMEQELLVEASDAYPERRRPATEARDREIGRDATSVAPRFTAAISTDAATIEPPAGNNATRALTSILMRSERRRLTLPPSYPIRRPKYRRATTLNEVLWHTGILLNTPDGTPLCDSLPG
jgi:hypothetical protein